MDSDVECFRCGHQRTSYRVFQLGARTAGLITLLGFLALLGTAAWLVHIRNSQIAEEEAVRAQPGGRSRPVPKPPSLFDEWIQEPTR